MVTPPRRSALLFLLLVPALGLAQQTSRAATEGTTSSTEFAPGSREEPLGTPPRGLPPPPLVNVPEESAPTRWDAPEAPRTERSDFASGASGQNHAVAAAALPPHLVTDAPRDPVPRIAVDMVGGAAGGVVGVLGLGLAGYLAAAPTVGCNSDECSILAVMAGIAGGCIGVPLGTYLGGQLMGGQGRLWPTAVGSLVGWGGALLGQVTLNNGEGGGTPSTVMAAALLALPVIGATVGYELSQAPQAPVRHDTDVASRQSVRLVPVAGYAQGSARLGLMGSF
ncbi:GlsB/YeaQ/YmgE family stress response membrane protein [Corallococcus sp. H22C18031201]|uniref:GlsB/YeaQ/YmgE family stress response membrane protein n=1 Tax=Citreicoccus inhibens TaxID=2849499 RepID=UPI000E723A66|nr:GlsB/YeaQ/YmgE family stress response membrane protein [Citreicoccus inhibens]MBU8896166.1 GlsB/YeaQ/YmgE family stress response membrane protein [Citreicoccus inhibens]RJS26025.1 GlsB/YeaQ/YmgE family stress response membrane protein [Corallococcus sp. H22C18031201]